MHLLQSDIPLVTINGAADLDDRARIAALADHLVDPRGAQIRILRQGVADERQIRVEDAGPTQARADACRLALHRGEVEVGRLGERDFVATIEPWHGPQVVVYREEAGSWERQVVDEIGSGHTIVTADFDGDGRDEIVYYRRGI